MDKFILHNSTQVAVQVTNSPAAGQTYKFGRQSQLEGRSIYAMRVLPEEAITADNNGNTPIAIAGLVSCNITLSPKGRGVTRPVDAMAATSFLTSSASEQANNELVYLAGAPEIDWQQSFLFLNAATGVSQNETLVLEVYYK